MEVWSNISGTMIKLTTSHMGVRCEQAYKTVTEAID
jgi:hypothetical protein